MKGRGYMMKQMILENTPYLFALCVFVAITTWKKLSARQELIEKAIDAAFYVVENMKHQTETKVDDKLAEGLGQLRVMLAQNKVKMNPQIAAKAEVRFNELHGRQKSSK